MGHVPAASTVSRPPISAAQRRCSASRPPGRPRSAACGRSSDRGPARRCAASPRPAPAPRRSGRDRSLKITSSSTISPIALSYEGQHPHRSLLFDATGVKMANMSHAVPQEPAAGSCSSTPRQRISAPSTACRSTVTAPDGTPVNAVRGTLDVLARQIRDLPRSRSWPASTRLAAGLAGRRDPVVQDAPGRRGRRRRHPGSLEVQVPIIEAVLDAIGLARCGVAEFEADDVIGTLRRRSGPARSTS